jgi:hypothetical protein
MVVCVGVKGWWLALVGANSESHIGGVNRDAVPVLFATRQTRARTRKSSDMTEELDFIGDWYSGGWQASAGSRFMGEAVGTR